MCKKEYACSRCCARRHRNPLFLPACCFSNVFRAVAADPDDDKILECAVVGSAHYIVTGDRRHLLPLVHYQGIPIITAAAFLTLIPAP